jgi:hypothetical protein
MGAFLGALGSALAAGAKGVAAGASKLASSKVGQEVKNNLKQKFGQGGQQKQQPQRLPPMQVTPPNPIGKPKVESFKKGGRVKKTGVYLLHKNEHVVPAKHRSNKAASRKKAIIKA